MIRIIAIGKKHDAWVEKGLARYERRLRPPFNVQWVLLPYSEKNGTEAREKESTSISRYIKPNDFVVLLDETGKSLSSVDFSHHIEHVSSQKPIVIIIGGAYGVGKSIFDRANSIVSLSKLVFPHMMVRLILLEQLYRAQEISRGGPYHHE